MNQVVVGVDGSDESRRAVAFAAQDARCREGGLVAVHVVEPRRLFDPDLRTQEDRTRQGRDELARIIESVVGDSDLEVEQRVLKGDPRHVLRDLSDETDHLVVGSRGRGTTEGLLLGSVSQYLISNMASPVTVMRDIEGPLRQVIVGVDGSLNSLRAVTLACGIARCHDAALTAIVVIPSGEESGAEVEEVLTQLRVAVEAADVEGSLDVEHRVMSGDPREVLRQASADADLLVLGSRGHGKLAGLVLGSVSNHLVTSAPCHVTVVPPEV